MARARAIRTAILFSFVTPWACFTPLLSGGCAREGEPLPSVILLSVDTLRADRLSCYGYGRPTSPRIDARIAARGVRFTNATSPSNNTSCSFASIHTGTYVRTHGVVSLAPLGFRVEERFETLAETLRSLGYKTAAAVSAAHLNAEVSGLGQGFDLFVDHAGKEPKRRAAATNAALLPPLKDLVRRDGGAAPLFLWVHYFDPHWPYEPEAEDLEALPLPEGSTGAPLPTQSLGAAFDPEDSMGYRGRKREIAALYDAEVHESDRGTGVLLDALLDLGVLENAIVVFTSDHGENLGEHGLFFNHSRLYEPVIRVPLLVSGPGIAPRTEGAMVHTIDLYPTILELVGAARLAPGSLEGESLAPLLRGGRAPVRDAVFSESGNWRDKAVKTSSGEKLVLPPGLFPPEIFDLSLDPGEEKDLAATRPERRDALAAAVADFAGPVTYAFRLVAAAGGPPATLDASVAFESPLEGDAGHERLLLDAAPGGSDEARVTSRFGGIFLRGLSPAVLADATLGTEKLLDHVVSVVVEPGATDDAPVSIRREPGDGARGETIVVSVRPSPGVGAMLKLRLGSSGRFGAPDLSGAPGFGYSTIEDGRRLRLTGRASGPASIRVPLEPPGALVVVDGARGTERLGLGEIAAGPKERPPTLYVPPTLLSAGGSPDDPRLREVLARPGLHAWREPGRFRFQGGSETDLDPAERRRLLELGYLGGPNNR